MSNGIRKHPLNAPGKYYVDQDCCTSSAACVDVAPEHYKMDADYNVYVSKQPGTPEEEALCREGMEGCPVAAIYDDGEP
ncbi:MAG TPA: ferredoxin [Pyrinomonadaceae bacterium]|nr:ferredoxin [Pyrinomonadaceae bacterium]